MNRSMFAQFYFPYPKRVTETIQQRHCTLQSFHRMSDWSNIHCAELAKMIQQDFHRFRSKKVVSVLFCKQAVAVMVSQMVFEILMIEEKKIRITQNGFLITVAKHLPLLDQHKNMFHPLESQCRNLDRFCAARPESAKFRNRSALFWC